MGHEKNTGLLGFFGLIACVVLYFGARQFFPALSTALLWIFGIGAALIVALVAVVIFAAFHKPKKTPEQERNEVHETLLKSARQTLMELRAASLRIKNHEIRSSAGEICARLDQILKTLREQPEDLPKARSFLNQSLPMLSGILKKYARLEQSGIPNAQVTAATITCLQNLETAAAKQYENLFDNDIVDITADMEVLTQLCRKNGLLEEELSL